MHNNTPRRTRAPILLMLLIALTAALISTHHGPSPREAVDWNDVVWSSEAVGAESMQWFAGIIWNGPGGGGQS